MAERYTASLPLGLAKGHPHATVEVDVPWNPACLDCHQMPDTPQHELGGCPGKPVDKSSTPETIRKFDTGATRDTASGKLDYEGFLSPIVLKAFAEYMDKNRVQSDGTLRDSDNWQKGIPTDSYMSSLWRHFMDVWLLHRGYEAREGVDMEEALCATIFNAMGYLFEHLKQQAA